MLIREGQDLLCWEKRIFPPPPRMLLDTETIQSILDLMSELIEVARLHGVPVHDIFACMDVSMSAILNINAIFQRAKSELDLPLQALKTEEEALWGWKGKQINISLKEGPTGWIDISHNSIFCVLGYQDQILQAHRIQWSTLERTTHHWGKIMDRFRAADINTMRMDIEQKLASFQWIHRPHNLIISGEPVERFAQLFPNLQSTHDAVFSRATIRKWIDHLAQTSKKQRNTLMGMNSPWSDGILTTCLVLMEMCNRSFKDSFTLSEGEIALGILSMIEKTD